MMAGVLRAEKKRRGQFFPVLARWILAGVGFILLQLGLLHPKSPYSSSATQHHHHHHHHGRHLVEEHPHDECRVGFADHVKHAADGMSAGNYTCPCCGWSGPKFDPVSYGKGRNDAICPHCQALERNRNTCAFVGSHPEILDVVEQEKDGDVQQSNALRLFHFQPHKPTAMVLDNSTYRLDHIWMDYHDDIYNEMTSTKTIHVDLGDLQFPDNFTHGVFLFHVLEHIADLDTALLELKRVVKPNGWLMIEVPLRDSGFKQSLDCRNLSSNEERVKCGGAHTHRWRFAQTDFEQRLAEYFECTDTAKMIVDRVGKAAYDAFQVKSNGKLVPQYFCRNSG